MYKSGIQEKAFSQDELTKFREIITKLKSYKDGTIHRSDYLQFLNAIQFPATPQQVEAYNDYFCTPYGDELIREKDIIKILSVLHDAKLYCLEIAKHFDSNGDGVISKDEFEVGFMAMKAFDPSVFGEKGDIKFEELLLAADANKDGKLQVEELADWFCKKNRKE